jgi:hypothetical protein
MHAPVRIVPHVRRRPGGALALVLLAAVAAPAAAAPRDELLRLVPDDVAFCLLLQDLRGHAAALRDSPFIEQVRTSAVGQALRNAQELTSLDAIQDKLRKHLGIDWARLSEDILGDALVLAYKPGPPGKEDAEQGLILVRAREARPLADLVERINRVQKESGALKELEEREYQGIKYYKRVDRKETGYYSLRGPVLLYSGQEDMLRQALERERNPAAAESAVARSLRDFGADRDLFALWINPRALDAEVEGKTARAAEKEPARAAAHRTVALCWKALDALVLSVHLDRDLTVSLGVRGRPEQMPTGVRRFLAECARPSELGRVFPDNALFALALHVNAPALFEAIGDFLPPEGRAELRTRDVGKLNVILGQDFIKDILPAIGPDWGMCVAPPAGEKGWFPEILAAVAVSAGDGPAPVDQAVLSALQFAATAAVLGHNNSHPDRPLSVRTEKVDKQEVKSIVGDLLPGLQPALGLRSGYLVLASSPEVLGRFRFPPGPRRGGPGKAAAEQTPLLRLSFKETRAYLQQRRAALAQALADKEGLTAEDAALRLDSVLTALQFVDRVELRQRTGPGQVVFSLVVQPAQPFRK